MLKGECVRWQSIIYIHDYEVVRNPERCIACRVCERQCANEAHTFDAELKHNERATDAKCVNCHRCDSLCPTRALKIVKTDHTFKENANWTGETIKELYRQAGTGGVLLSSMGNPKPYPVYWDRLLINASAGRRILPSICCVSRWRPAPTLGKSRSISSGTKTGRLSQSGAAASA